MSGETRVREADLTGPDAESVRGLVEAYLVQTEREKAERAGGEADSRAELPERYRREVDDPARAYANATALLAELDGATVGVIVVQRNPTTLEIKRVWVDPSARGRRVGSSLLDAALAQHDLPVRLTVWEWREDALRLYRARGFVPVPSWDARAGLVCMERPQR